MNTFYPVLHFARVRDVKAPCRAHETDAGIDLAIPDDFPSTALRHGESIVVPSGLKFDVPYGWMLLIKNKSGVSSKLCLDVMACVVDQGYEGEVGLSVINNGLLPVELRPGMKLVQAVLLPVGRHVPTEVPEAELFATKSSRGSNGFGSSGV